MDIYIMQFKSKYKYLLVKRDANVHVYKYDKQKVDPPILSFQSKTAFIGKSKDCPMTEFSGAVDKIGFDGNTLFTRV